MCGIGGLIGARDEGGVISRRLLAALRHRGARRRRYDATDADRETLAVDLATGKELRRATYWHLPTAVR